MYRCMICGLEFDHPLLVICSEILDSDLSELAAHGMGLYHTKQTSAHCMQAAGPIPPV